MVTEVNADKKESYRFVNRWYYDSCRHQCENKNLHRYDSPKLLQIGVVCDCGELFSLNTSALKSWTFGLLEPHEQEWLREAIKSPISRDEMAKVIERGGVAGSFYLKTFEEDTE